MLMTLSQYDKDGHVDGCRGERKPIGNGRAVVGSPDMRVAHIICAYRSRRHSWGARGEKQSTASTAHDSVVSGGARVRQLLQHKRLRGDSQT